jgi:hypothetical protein
MAQPRREKDERAQGMNSPAEKRGKRVLTGVKVTGKCRPTKIFDQTDRLILSLPEHDGNHLDLLYS